MSEYVNFYKGKHADFANLTSYQPGAFYLTTDSERLYFANGTNSILDLNQYVIFVTDVQTLSTITNPQKGDIYYCEAENVLCTHNGNGWVQININTDTITTKLESTDEVEEVEQEDGSKKKVIHLTFALTEKTSSTLDEESRTLTTDWYINPEDVYAIIPESKVEIETHLDASSGAMKINTTGDGSLKEDDAEITKIGVTIVPGTNLHFHDEGNSTITMNAVEYNLSSPAGSTNIVLQDDGLDSDQEKYTVGLTAGHQLKIDGSAKDTITYAHGDITSTKSDGTTTEGDAAWSTVVEYIEKIDTHNGEESTSTNGNGHVFGYDVAKITFPDEPEYNLKEFRIGSKEDTTEAGSLYIKVTDEAQTGTSHTFDGEILKGLYYKIKNDANQDEVYYNTEYLPVYTIDQVEARLKGLNAITYKGTLTPESTFPSEGVRIGDAYMATKIGDYGDATTKFTNEKGETITGILEHVEAGDLFIATGTESTEEDTYGEIVSSTLVWTYVPAGNDYDSQYWLEHNNNTVTLKGNTSANPDMPGFNGSITFDVNHTENDDILVSSTATNPAGNTDVGKVVNVKYAHKEYGETAGIDNRGSIAYNDSVTFKAIGEVQNGHIKSHNDLTFVMPEAQDVTIYSTSTEPTLRLSDYTKAAGGSVAFVDDSQNNVKIIEAVAAAENQIKFKHRRNCATEATPGTGQSLEWSGKLSWVENLTPTAEGDGHIAEYVVTQYQMPADPSVKNIALSNTNTSEHQVSVKQTVTSPNGQSPTINSTVSFKTATDSLVLNTTADSTSSNNNAVSVSVDLVWKSF